MNDFEIQFNWTGAGSIIWISTDLPVEGIEAEAEATVVPLSVEPNVESAGQFRGQKNSPPVWHLHTASATTSAQRPPAL